MTDQDPTQQYEAPPPAPSAAPEAPPPSPETAPPAFAPAPETVATAPVTATPAPRRRGGLVKWVAAVAVVLLVAGTAAAATVLLTGDAGTPAVASWTPASSVEYMEVRLDMPGSQQAEVAKLLSAFPGFDDQAAFTTKMNEALDQLVGKVSNGKQSYTADIQPWFGGQLAASIGAIPSAADPASARILALAGVTDAAKAEAWAASVLTETGATTSTETYKGVTITKLSSPPADSPAMPAIEAGYAVIGPVLAIGDVASIKASIDTGGKTGIDTDPEFKQASASLTGDRLGFLFADTKALMAAANAAGADMPAGMPSLPSFLSDMAAPWVASAIRAENGALVSETRQPHVASAGPAKSAESKLPSVVPPGTVVLIDGHDTGQALQRLKAMLASDPSLADGLKQVDDALNLVGGLDALTGWMGESGIAIANTGGGVGGGLVVVPTDPAAAKRLFTQLRGFIQIGGGQAGISVKDETYGDATITTVDLSGLAPMAGATGVPLPADLGISYAVTDDVVVLGYGTDFVKGVLDARTGASLAETDRFKDALGRVDKVNGSLVWVDIDGVRTLVEPLIPADGKAKYESDIKPYLEPFEVYIATSVPGDDIDTGKAVITVAGQ